MTSSGKLNSQRVSKNTPRKATDRTLGLVDIWQVLRKLYWEMELLSAFPISFLPQERSGIFNFKDAKSYAEINIAATNLSLIDWLYHRLMDDEKLALAFKKSHPNVPLIKLNAFSNALRNEILELKICHQICNANKHFKLTDGFDITVCGKSVDFVRLDDDEKTILEIRSQHNFFITLPCSLGGMKNVRISSIDAFKTLISWWTSLLKQLEIPKQDIFFPELDGWPEF